MPNSVLSGGRENQLLRELIFVHTFHRWGDLVFIIGDCVSFPCWMVMRYPSPMGRGISFPYHYPADGGQLGSRYCEIFFFPNWWKFNYGDWIFSFYTGSLG